MVRVKKGPIYYTTELPLKPLIATRMSKLNENPLGKDVDFPQKYSPDVLCSVLRSDARESLDLGSRLPFHGEDLWNAWELTWLDGSGRPVVATAALSIPADSEKMVESKSLKLYLNSFAMTGFATARELQGTISVDLSRLTNCAVAVTIITAANSEAYRIDKLPGTCIDAAQGQFSAADVDPALLQANHDQVVSEELHSHLLRSHCPVTDQPDIGSILVRYRGPKLDQAALLQYIVSFRQHNDYHEACVERMFMDIKRRCEPDRLTVYARYTRRGGIDINPFRSDFEKRADNTRLWRQ